MIKHETAGVSVTPKRKSPARVEVGRLDIVSRTRPTATYIHDRTRGVFLIGTGVGALRPVVAALQSRSMGICTCIWASTRATAQGPSASADGDCVM
jgi:hypothetical protein